MGGDLSHEQKQYLCRKRPYARAGHQTGEWHLSCCWQGQRASDDRDSYVWRRFLEEGFMLTISRYRPATQRSGAPVLVAAGGAAVTVPALAS